MQFPDPVEVARQNAEKREAKMTQQDNKINVLLGTVSKLNYDMVILKQKNKDAKTAAKAANKQAKEERSKNAMMVLRKLLRNARMKAVGHSKPQQDADLDDADRLALGKLDLSDFMKQTGMSEGAAQLVLHTLKPIQDAMNDAAHPAISQQSCNEALYTADFSNQARADFFEVLAWMWQDLENDAHSPDALDSSDDED